MTFFKFTKLKLLRMRHNMKLIVLVCVGAWLCGTSDFVAAATDRPDKIVCYFSNWAVQRPGLGAMIPEHIDPCLCTHLIYAFSEMKDNKLTPMEKYDQADGDKAGFFERMNNLKQKNPKLKTLLAVGGWDMGMGAFTTMVKDDKNIKKFVTSTIEYLKKYNFDGLDLDFEYPGIDWRGSPPEDKMAFTKLCKMLREAFEEEGKKSGKDRMLLTAAVAGARNTIDKAYEVDKICEYVDWLNLMTYDLHGPWDTNAGHHSAIHGKDKQDYLYIDFIIKHYESKGAPRNKLVLGLANYGRSDSPAMPYTGFKGESGFIAYYETCIMLACEGWKEFWNEPQLVPYAKGKENFPWAGYDNVKSMKIKAEYIIKEKLGGAMFWTVDLDDFTGKFCCQGFFPLIRTVKSVLENDPSMMPPAKICNSCPNKEYKDVKKKYRKKRSADEICTEKGEGVWGDPNDCTKYYVCRSMSTSWAEKKQEVCYSGSYFDPKSGQCKWVGQGNYNCDDILGKEGESSSDKESTSSDKPADEKKDDKKKSKSKVPDAESMKDTIIPADLYTCRAEPEVPLEQNPDYIKCHSCEAESPKTVGKCKNPPKGDSTTWCNVKNQQKCFSKAVYKEAGKRSELVSFTRGCATLADLDLKSSSSDDANGDAAPPPTSAKSTSCVKKSSSQICYETCEKSLCNTNSELKSSSGNSNLAGTSMLFIVFVLIVSSYINL